MRGLGKGVKEFKDASKGEEGKKGREEKMGEGGMGSVYRARHAFLRRPTAVKMLNADKVTEGTLARFEREVQLTSRLSHPNTIAVYDYGRTPDGVFYYAMEYLEGIDLEDLVKKFGPLPEGRVRSEVLELAQAAGVRVGEVYSVDASRRTSGANAYVTGLGPTKRVVLYDTLLDRYAWHGRNSHGRAAPVGSLKPNDLGLFDTLGNAWEWCHDALADYPAGPAEDRDQPGAVLAEKQRVLRGGGFLSAAAELRSAQRFVLHPQASYSQAGFRVARTWR